MGRLTDLTDRLGDEVSRLATHALVPGVLVGVWHQDEEARLSHGTANVVTGAPMTTETAWLLGSITKVLTTTLVLRLVERGALSLDECVQRYLPEFTLADADSARRLTLRHLLNHTSGIDADTLMPTRVDGANAVRAYVAALAPRGTLFAPGELVHYSNPGFCLAGRVAEVVAGTPFGELLETEVFAPTGMAAATTSTDQAILGPVAVGSFADPLSRQVRPTTLFRLPASVAPAGATPIVTLGDMLAFGRMHLADGVAPNGTRVISREHAQAMRTVNMDMATPNVPPVGLGWWVVPVGGLDVLWHAGGSPGGTSSLIVIPDHDLVVSSFANGAGSGGVHDAILASVLDELLGVTVALPPLAGTSPAAMRYQGDYAAFQMRIRVTHDAEGMAMTPELLPVDDAHRRIAAAYLGSTPTSAVVHMDRVCDGLFAPKGMPSALLTGLSGRTSMVSFHDPDPGGHPRYLHHGLRIARRRAEPADRRQDE